MKWRGRVRSSNIEDRRGRGGFGGGLGGFNPLGGNRGGPSFRIPTGGSRGGGFGGIGLIIVVVIIMMAMGINPLTLLDSSSIGTNGIGSSQSRPLPNAGEDELADFVSVVIKETEDLWTAKAAAIGRRYSPPGVVLFTDRTSSGCGAASANSGPFYCPADQKIYIDLSFYDQLRRQFGAPGDFAQAYVLAHEVGHHVQALEGTLADFNANRSRMSETEANAYSVRIELQADCYAGVWAHYAGQQDLLEGGDVEEAINAANQIGDDVLTRGTLAPRNFTHGTAAQRKEWLQRGMASGDPADCDTLNGSV